MIEAGTDVNLIKIRYNTRIHALSNEYMDKMFPLYSINYYKRREWIKTVILRGFNLINLTQKEWTDLIECDVPKIKSPVFSDYGVEDYDELSEYRRYG